MKLNVFELIEILDQLEIPYRYREFLEKTYPPFIIYVEEKSHNFAADNKVYRKNPPFRLELYTSNKDFELEERLEDLLDANDIYWEKSEDIRIQSEKVTLINYYI